MLQATTAIGKNIADIATCLALPENQLQEFGYTNGLLGKALFFLYYGAYADDNTYLGRTGKLLNQSLSQLAEPYKGRNYYKESAELGTFLEYMKANGLVDDSYRKILSAIDQTQVKGIAHSLKLKTFDPQNGALVGGLYFLARSRSSEAARSQLENLALALIDLACKDPSGNLYWRSQLFSSGKVYLGISHGMAVVVLYLCSMCEMDILADRCRETIQQAVHYVLSHQQDYQRTGCFFPDIVGETPSKTRLGLCYGDMGVGYSLYRAAGVLNDDRIRRKALEVFDQCALRTDPDDHQVRDASVLYGASGVALLFDKMYELTRLPALDRAALAWYAAIPAFAVHANSTAGYAASFNQRFSHTNVAFMEGIAGIGCTLIKYTQRDQYSFDEFIWLL